MSLLDDADMMVDVAIMDKKSIPDELGGFTYEWLQGAEFKALIIKDTSSSVRIAEKEGFTEAYTVVTHSSVNLTYHDIIKRLSDGALFRITGRNKNSQAPERSTIHIRKTYAEPIESLEGMDS